MFRKLTCYFIISYVLLFDGCQKPAAPEYLGFENIQIGKLNTKESIISTNLKFYNPNSFGLQMKKAEMDIYINEKLMDHYLLDSTIFIAKRDTFYIPVSVKINFGNIFSNALQSLLTNEVRIRLNGNVRLKKGNIGFKVPIQYEQSEKLDSLF
jgi:LEA14-like dessication related protein